MDISLQQNRKHPVFSFAVLFGLLILCSGCGLDRSRHHGEGYSFKIPPKNVWKLVKEKKKKSIFKREPEGTPQIVTYATKERVDKTSNIPVAIISVATVKLSQAAWIDDEFPIIVDTIKRSGFKIKEKGEIKLDGRINKWILYSDQKGIEYTLEFYYIDDTNVMIKLRYSSTPKGFQKYRMDFEFLKDSLRYTTFNFT